MDRDRYALFVLGSRANSTPLVIVGFTLLHALFVVFVWTFRFSEQPVRHLGTSEEPTISPLIKTFISQGVQNPCCCITVSKASCSVSSSAHHATVAVYAGTMQNKQRQKVTLTSQMELTDIWSKEPIYDSCDVFGSSGRLLSGQSNTNGMNGNVGKTESNKDFKQKQEFTDRKFRNSLSVPRTATFRMNSSPTRGYEVYVGEKETIRVFNDKFLYDHPDFGDRFKPSHPHRFDFLEDYPFRKPGYTPLTILFKVHDWALFEKRKVQLERDYPGIRVRALDASFVHLASVLANGTWPTTGILTVLSAAMLCKSTHLYGFDGPAEMQVHKQAEAKSGVVGKDTKRTAGERYHYYDHVMPQGGFAKTPHKFDAEFAVYQALEAYEKLTIH